MSDMIKYKDQIIHARPRQEGNSEEWTNDGYIEIYKNGEKLEILSVKADGSYADRESAVGACHKFGKAMIDKSSVSK